MKKITKAINEGLNLIDFGNDKILKASKINNNYNIYDLGDFVYYDKNIGYNNAIGEKVAMCVNDEDDNMLFVVLDHILTSLRFKLANESTPLQYDTNTRNMDSYKATRYFLNNYKYTAGNNTIWAHLEKNEYIPSKDELIKVYHNFSEANRKKLYDIKNFDGSTEYWSISLDERSSMAGAVYVVDFDINATWRSTSSPKCEKYKTLVFLKIDN